MRRRLGVAFLALLLLLSMHRPAAAQNLQTTLERVASAWQRGDASAISALSARAGISLDVNGVKVGPLGSRQSAAVLRGVFEDRETVNAKIGTVREAPGDATLASASITWLTRVKGTTVPEPATVFLVFAREENGWRLAEIRLLR